MESNAKKMIQRARYKARVLGGEDPRAQRLTRLADRLEATAREVWRLRRRLQSDSNQGGVS